MRTLFGLLFVIAGIVLGVWLGIWVMFIGGIVQIIDSIKSTPVNALQLAYGVAKLIFSGVVGWFAGLLVSGVGLYMLNDN